MSRGAYKETNTLARAKFVVSLSSRRYRPRDAQQCSGALRIPQPVRNIILSTCHPLNLTLAPPCPATSSNSCSSSPPQRPTRAISHSCNPSARSAREQTMQLITTSRLMQKPLQTSMPSCTGGCSLPPRPCPAAPAAASLHIFSTHSHPLPSHPRNSERPTAAARLVRDDVVIRAMPRMSKEAQLPRR